MSEIIFVMWITVAVTTFVVFPVVMIQISLLDKMYWSLVRSGMAEFNGDVATETLELRRAKRAWQLSWPTRALDPHWRGSSMLQDHLSWYERCHGTKV